MLRELIKELEKIAAENLEDGQDANVLVAPNGANPGHAIVEGAAWHDDAVVIAASEYK